MEYDPSTTTFEDLLRLFWKFADPFTCQKRQYMSVIFYHTEEQKQKAEESLAKIRTDSPQDIVTKILPAGKFYKAEDYHQKYLLKQHSWLVKSLDLDEDEVGIVKSHVAARLSAYVSGFGTHQGFLKEAKVLGLDKDQIDYIVEEMGW
ncbi:PREDICTED: peptide methionine sulfoxide reductase-like isoform X2 [Priapulus caudatus]|uniref:peptide-methionine (S)-S-oxide reductase n=1 Tax=Priapulus caudatus TaxID=37621 RepID=A0ABM1DW75_PRICU|nr:PREDICTED: peptide methionine sulfoxide reductase-like isoform X2 [Priapulus caudatus]